MKCFFDLNTDFKQKDKTNHVELNDSFSANFFFFLIHGFSVHSTKASVTTVLSLQVFQIINSTC